MRPMVAKTLRVLCGLLALSTLVSACGKSGDGEYDGNRPSGPILYTLPVAEGQSETVTIDGETVSVRVPKPWDTDEIRVELLGNQSILHVSIYEELHEEWRRYMSALDGERFVVRIKDVDLMILEANRGLKPVGMWQIGPRESAEPRAQELLSRMSARD